MTTSQLPYFLTRSLVEENDVVGKALEFLFSFKAIQERHCHIVIVVPEVVQDTSEPGRSLAHKIVPYILYESSVGKEDWKYDLDKIAQSKASQLWHDFADGSLLPRPHLLFDGDTIWVGGVKREGIVVTCSGFEEYFDRMIASIIADVCIALARHEYENSTEKKNTSDLIGDSP